MVYEFYVKDISKETEKFEFKEMDGFPKYSIVAARHFCNVLKSGLNKCLIIIDLKTCLDMGYCSKSFVEQIAMDDLVSVSFDESVLIKYPDLELFPSGIFRVVSKNVSQAGDGFYGSIVLSSKVL